MGKKKGKGKGQPKGPGGDDTKPESSTSSETLSTSQERTLPQPQGTQQSQQQQGQRKQKQRKQQEAAQEQQQQQEQQREPPQQQQQQQRQQRGPPQQQQQRGSPQQQQGQQQRGPPQQQQQRDSPQQQQQQRGPPQQQQGQRQRGPPQQQQQRGSPQQQQQQQRGSQQQRGPPQQRQQQPQRGPPQQQSQQWTPQQQAGFPQQMAQQRPRGQQPGMHPQSPQTMSPPGMHPQSPQTMSPPSMYPQSPQTMSPPSMYPQSPQTMSPPSMYPQSPQTMSPPSMYPQSPQTMSPPGMHLQSPQRMPAPRMSQPQQLLPGQQQPTLPPPTEEARQATSTSTFEKEKSPLFGGQGDCLKQVAVVQPGTRGRKIVVESNHLSLNIGKLLVAYHYDVNITPETPKCLLRDVMNIFGQRHYPNRHPAYDGRKNLYSPIKLPFGPKDSLGDTITVEGENNRPREFRVEVKLARSVDLSPLHDMLKTKTSPQDALQCLDIVLRNAPSNTCINAGRCFFTPPTGQIIPLGDGMEMYYGFYQSAIRGWKPLLNVDVAHKAFPHAQNVLDLICELGSDFRGTMTKEQLSRPIHDTLRDKLEKFLKMLKVKYEITGQPSSKRIYRVNGLGEIPSRARFQQEGQEMTVEAYFNSVKRVKLRYPHLPTVWVGSKDRNPKILLPLEFCTVVEGQSVNRRMNENQTSAMIKKAATNTEVRKQKIMDTLRKANFNNDPCIREFGFSVSNQFEKLEARVLQPPALVYANNEVVRPQKGVWRADRSKFLVGAHVEKWTIACVTRTPCRVESLADMVFKFASSSGMQMTARATPPFQHIGPRQNLPDIINYFRMKQGFDLIFVVVPNSGPQYAYVKKAAELNVGCLTQCIKQRTLDRLNPQTVVNILLKVNSKLNGTNHTWHQPIRPPILNRPCMIMGADVTHPSPEARDIPSVAAVTASHDPRAFQYNICWRLQPPKVEIIEDLCNITIEQLTFFYKKTNCKPERIIFFRDGVSEGQFREVQRAEISAIQRACKKLQSDGYEPKITFLVVQKRHHTRLFPTNPKDSEDRNMNVPAGTCVDTHITNPTMQDFYLVSHASIQGVAKPTKYCTLWDDNKMSHDDIEELTYHLCHMFTRCNRSVSYPAPTYYAHLAAARAKVYIENDKLNMNNLVQVQKSYQIQESISKGKPMFFV